jgi:hypothetical protein
MSTWKSRLAELGADLGRGASPAELQAAETALGLAFPAEFRDFLAEVGWADLGEFSLAGLGEDIPEDLHLVSVTESARQEGISREFLPIADDHGEFFFLHAENGSVYLAAEGGVLRPVVPSFLAWLEEVLLDLDAEDEDDEDSEEDSEG